MIFNEPWHNGVNLCAIIQKSHTALPIYPYPGYIFNPIPSAKGIRIQEGSLCLASYTLGTLSWSTFGVAAFPQGVQVPSLVPSPLFILNVTLFWMPLLVDSFG